MGGSEGENMRGKCQLDVRVCTSARWKTCLMGKR